MQSTRSSQKSQLDTRRIPIVRKEKVLFFRSEINPFLLVNSEDLKVQLYDFSPSTRDYMINIYGDDISPDNHGQCFPWRRWVHHATW